MKNNRVSTGIRGLDPLIGGGVKEHTVNLVAGGPGSCKSIFAVQFILEGIKKGEAGIYVTFEETKKKFYEDLLSFGWDLEKHEKAGLFAFLEYTPEQVKNILTEGGGIVESVIEKIKAKRLVIDSITSFTLLYEDELTKKEAALALFALINKWGCTAILTSQDQSSEDHVISAALEFEVDGIILIYHVKRKGIRKRAIEVLKMRGTRTPEKTYPLEIDSNGLKINTSRVEVF
ncbi:MAG: ATPase domain-containing protein [Nanoarchaeota archaeon]